MSTLTLQDLLTLERPLIIFDAETTGPNPKEDRIVELALLQIKTDGTWREWSSYLDPEMPIPREATYGREGSDYAGHGITDEMVKGQPRFRDVADALLKGFTPDTDYGGYNIQRFDLPLLQAEFARAGHQWSYEKAAVIDAYRLWGVAQKRTLSDAVEAFLERKHEGAHGAISDVRATTEVTAAMLERFSTLPRTPRALHDLQWPKNPDALDSRGQIIWKDGVATMNFGSKWKGKPLTMMARKDLAWIASPACGGASPECKQICLAALRGQFPVPPAAAASAEEA